jgi:hypothetical protein
MIRSLERRSRRSRRLSLSAVAALALRIAGGAPAPAQEPLVLQIPENDIGVRFLEARAEAQRRTLGRFEVFHEFGFEDRLAESGITFVHRVVDDAGKFYKMVHYDHGNGVAAADVDGDSLLDVYFVTQLGRNELWRNLGGGAFEDITASEGVGLADRVGVAASFADIDNDGDADLFVTTVRMGNVLFENDGKGRFKDISSAAGVDYSGHSSGAVFLDYDNDGLLDLFVTNVGTYTTDERGSGGYWIGFQNAFDGHLHPSRTERSILYRNLGGNRFEDVSERTGLVDGSWSGDASATDLDADGYPEIYVLNMQGDDHYWLNDAGRFVERTAATFPKTPWGAMGIKFFDYDNDGLLDLILSDMHSDMSHEVGPDAEKLKSDVTYPADYLVDGSNNIFGNAFYENSGDGKFEEISDLIGAENYWPWGLSVGDLNADGWQDVFLASSMSFPWRYGINTVLLNNLGKTFLDSEFILGVEPRAGGRTKTPWFELDCSGSDRGYEHCRDREGRVRVDGNLGTRSTVLFDLEGDGDLDIVTSEFHAPPQVLVSDLAARRPVRFLQVRLIGTVSNRDGLGASVTVRAGDDVYTRYHDGKSGYLAQSSMPLYFGLGDHEKVDRIEVRWPSGRVDVVEDEVLSGSTAEIRESAAAE